VLIRLIECLGQLLAQTNVAQRPVLLKQIHIVVETGRRNIAQKEDLRVLEERSRLAVEQAEGVALAKRGTHGRTGRRPPR
jgi:hypothetical protein